MEGLTPPFLLCRGLKRYKYSLRYCIHIFKGKESILWGLEQKGVHATSFYRV